MINTARTARGFTLLELLAVVFVIGIAISFATISLSSGARAYEIKGAARQIAALSSLALEEAIITNSQFGLLFEIDKDSESMSKPDFLYRWLVLDYETNRWVPVENHELLNEVKLPPAISLEIEIEGTPIIIGAEKEEDSMFSSIKIIEEDEEQKKAKLQPDIYFMSSGELLPFEVKLAEAKEDSPVYRIKGEMIGRIRFYRPGDEVDED